MEKLYIFKISARAVFRKKLNSLKIKTTIYQIRKLNERCFFFKHICIYIQKLNQKSVFTKMPPFKFLISLCSYISLFLSLTYLSLPKMFRYAFYFHLYDMVQLSHFSVFFRRRLQQIFGYFSLR